MIEIVNEVSVTLINVSASDEMVAMSAWVSHDQDSEDRLKNINQVKRLIRFLYINKHMSPFEHGMFTFKIDAPLFVAREFFRHRSASYNEVSGRYTEMKPRFYSGKVARIQKGKPGDYYFEDGTDEQTAIYLKTKEKALKASWKAYQQRLEAGIAKEQAREELPLSLMTQWYVTMNPRNLMHFLTLRNENHALKEIQDVAVQMERFLAEQMPFTYAAYIEDREGEGEVVDKPKENTFNVDFEQESANGETKKSIKDIRSLTYAREARDAQEGRISDMVNAYSVVVNNQIDSKQLERLGEDIIKALKAGRKRIIR